MTWQDEEQEKHKNFLAQKRRIDMEEAVKAFEKLTEIKPHPQHWENETDDFTSDRSYKPNPEADRVNQGGLIFLAICFLAWMTYMAITHYRG